MIRKNSGKRGFTRKPREKSQSSSTTSIRVQSGTYKSRSTSIQKKVTSTQSRTTKGVAPVSPQKSTSQITYKNSIGLYFFSNI